ncbi:unnamed protein product [Caenorhabditis brenneri]
MNTGMTVDQGPLSNQIEELLKEDYVKELQNGSKTHRLLRFIPNLINSGKHCDKIDWLNPEKTSFIFIKPHLVTKLYGAAINNPGMKYDNLCRTLRTYCKQGMTTKVEGVQSAWSINTTPIVPSPMIKSTAAPEEAPEVAPEAIVDEATFAQLLVFLFGEHLTQLTEQVEEVPSVIN